MKKNGLLFIAIVIIVYLIAKIYVINTPNPNDDCIPDDILGIVVEDF